MHEAFAAQVLSILAMLESDEFAQEELAQAGAVGAVGFPIVYERVLPLLTALLGALALAWSIGREHDIWMIGILAFLGMAVQIIIAGRR